MEPWEIDARESIRDLVARYNANGDSGHIDQLLDLFAPDAVMVAADMDECRGRDEIQTIFTRAVGMPNWANHPVYVRHMTATLQIDLLDSQSAKSRCYYAVLTAVGLDHWGRYIDEYRRLAGVWKFSRRNVTLDGRSPDSIFVPS
jgi:ketosteroid isomerase-like protein